MRAGGDRACERGFDVVDDDIDMHRGPMAIVAARILAAPIEAARLSQKIDPNRQAAELDGLGAEPARYREAEGLGVEGDRFGEIGTSMLISRSMRRA